MDNIANKLKKLRKENGFKQAQVAYFLDITREEVSYYENGKRNLNLSLLQKFADLYEVNIAYFLEESEEKIKTNCPTNLSIEDKKKVEFARKFINNIFELNNF